MVLVIDPQIAGASGDMLLCSLVDLGADKTKIIDGVKSCAKFLPGSVIHTIDFKKKEKNGINSVELILEISEERAQRKGLDIKQAIISSINELNLSDKARLFAESCIDSPINSESKIHGRPAESVHFHEAASLDTVVDIVGVAISLESLGLFDEEIICMPIAVGSGSVTFSHGTTSNPASAVLEILKNSGLSIHGSSVRDELTTPTGACILKNLASSSMDYYPHMEITSIGYGSGKKDFELFSNVLKIVLGRQKQTPGVERVKVLETNVDDVSGEILGGLFEKLMKKGAKDVSIYPGITKKNRPTNLVSIICDDGTLEGIIDTVINETGTLGMRVSDSERFVLPRTVNSITMNLGGKTFDIRYKISSFKEKTHLKVEFDDLQEISNYLNKSLKETELIVRKEIERKSGNDGQA